MDSVLASIRIAAEMALPWAQSASTLIAQAMHSVTDLLISANLREVLRSSAQAGPFGAVLALISALAVFWIVWSVLRAVQRIVMIVVATAVKVLGVIVFMLVVVHLAEPFFNGASSGGPSTADDVFGAPKFQQQYRAAGASGQAFRPS
ncbi:hypothetical protein GGF31_003564 [Allomyces arbusculus]|nr:hypothetical protein GGF31_003564 [Allomyces arbusculus]